MISPYLFQEQFILADLIPSLVVISHDHKSSATGLIKSLFSSIALLSPPYKAKAAQIVTVNHCFLPFNIATIVSAHFAESA